MRVHGDFTPDRILIKYSCAYALGGRVNFDAGTERPFNFFQNGRGDGVTGEFFCRQVVSSVSFPWATIRVNLVSKPRDDLAGNGLECRWWLGAHEVRGRVQSFD